MNHIYGFQRMQIYCSHLYLIIISIHILTLSALIIIHYYSNIAIDESYLRTCIHENITTYIQKNGKDIDPKNPHKEFNITVKITPLKRFGHDMY